MFLFVSIANRRQYLNFINQAFSEQFETLDHYKHETNFKRLLSKMTLNDVKEAIRRSEAIMNANQECGYILYQYKGYKYYTENPSLSIWEIVRKILVESGLY